MIKADGFYAVMLTAINGRQVSKLQPIVRLELALEKAGFTEQQPGKITKILAYNPTGIFETQDANHLRISVEYKPARTRTEPAHPFHFPESWHFCLCGSLEINQQTSESLVLSSRKSKTIFKINLPPFMR